MSPDKLRIYRRARAVADILLPILAGQPPSLRIAEQTRASVTSITHNIAEGCGRTTTAERLQMLSHARGSLWETVDALADLERLKLLTSEQRESLDRELRQTSTQIALFAAALVDKDPDYKGAYRFLADEGYRIRQRHAERISKKSRDNSQ